MADRKLDRKLASAASAYENGDRRGGSRLVKEILGTDFHHAGCWELLYEIYGGELTFQEFQRVFTEKFYPEKLPLLDTGTQPITDMRVDLVPEKKGGSLFGRLIDSIRRIIKPGETIAGQGEVQTAQTSTRPQGTNPPKSTVSRVSLKPAGREKAQEPPGTPAAPLPSIPLPHSGQQSHSMTPGPVSHVGAGSDNGKIRILVVDDIDVTRENIIRALQFEENFDVVGFARNGVQAIEKAHHHNPDVVVMDVNMPDMDGLTATAYIRRELPITQVVILTVQDDIDYMRQAMMAGARDFLTKPPMIEELVTAVEKANQYAVEAREKASLLATTQMHQSAMAQRGRIISLYSPRGGSGCSMLATNLAASLYKEDTPVVVVDGNLQFGDIPVLFNVQTRGNILDLTTLVDELDTDLVNEVLGMHSSGIHLLAPPKPEIAERVTGDQFSQLLRYLSHLFAYVIVDTHHRIEDVNLAAFDVSDLLILVITQDIPSIARLRRFLDLYDLLRFDPQRLFVVMNRYDKHVGIKPEKVGETFKHEVAVTIPDHIQIALPAVNRGVPLMLKPEMHPTPIGQAIIELVDKMGNRLSELEEAVPMAETEEI